VTAAAVTVDVGGWVEEFASAFARIAGRFRRREPRLQARSFLVGVLSDVDTRSCWQLAEQAGDASPQAMQRLLGEAVWDADAVRDDVRGYVIDTIGHSEAVLILDDTGDLKAGRHSVGCSANTPEPPAGSRTRRCRCSLPMRPRPGGH
jgi:SRSO17 transposase